MDFNKIKDLMQSLDSSSLMDFELKLNDGFYLRMNKYKTPSLPNTNQVSVNNDLTDNIGLDNSQENTLTPTNIALEKEEVKEIKEGSLVKSPIVGTFYASSSPTKPSYVKVGDTVKEGDILCIIEAMKVMNEITSPYNGTVAEILVENEDMVEYNQPLFKIV